MAFREAFDGEFAIDDSNDDAAITWRQCAIDNQDITGVDPGFMHGFTSYPDEERRGRMLDEMLIEVQGAIKIIIGGGKDIQLRRGPGITDTRIASRHQAQSLRARTSLTPFQDRRGLLVRGERTAQPYEIVKMEMNIY